MGRILHRILIALLFMLVLIQSAYATQSITVVTNGGKTTYSPGYVMAVAGQVRDSGTAVRNTDVFIQISRSGSPVYYASAKTNSAGYYMTVFTVPSDFSDGSYTLTASTAEASEVSVFTMQQNAATNSLSLIGSEPAGSANTPSAVIPVATDTIALAFNVNVNYFVNKTDLPGAIIGENENNEDCIKVYKGTDKTRISADVKLVDDMTAGSASTSYYDLSGTQKSTSKQCCLILKLNESLETNTIYTVKISKNLCSNNGSKLGTDQVLYFKTGQNSNQSNTSSGNASLGGSGSLDDNGGGTKGQVKVTASLNKNTGTATATVDATALKAAFSQAAAGANGSKTVEVELSRIDHAVSYESTLPASFLTSGTAQQKVEIKTALATVTMPGNMINEALAVNANAVSLHISQAEKADLPEAVQSVIGYRPVIELSLKIDGKSASWSNSSAPVTVTIPYTPTAEERKDPEHITVWYIDGSGNAVAVPSGKYDPQTGKVTFSTTHFSKYAVTSVYKTFSDIGKYSWAKQGIEVLASKGIINGTSNDTYSPGANITRADFITLLVKTLGLTADVRDNFSDVKVDTYYYDAVGIAKQLGITTGSGNGLFNPKTAISRQDMMVLAERALKVADQIDPEASETVLDQFTDKSDISGYAVSSLATLVKEGLITGSGNTINPDGNTTRAEIAVFLYRIYNL